MSRRSPLFVLIPALLLSVACGRSDAPQANDDFAVLLAQDQAGYAQAAPGRALSFPADHGPHPDFRVEWWYLTANLEDPDGRPHGAQWTLFRLAADAPGPDGGGNPWQSGQVYMAHFAVTTPDGHRSFQRYSRGGDHGGEARAGVTARPFAAWLDDWTLRSRDEAWLPLEVRARQDGHALNLLLAGDAPVVLQGDGGFSQKHPDGGGSHYYSQPFLTAEGTIEAGGEAVAVSGRAWLDREWSSQFLQGDQSGWDWFSLHLDSGEKLMLFRLRGADDSVAGSDFLHGVLIGPDGAKRLLDPGGIMLTETKFTAVAGRDLPLHWRIELPGIGRSLAIEPLHPEQWMDVDFPYWEGVVLVRGEGAGNSGMGYLELTGYSRR